MRISKAKTKLRAGKPVRICGLGHFIPSYIRHAAHFGFDCVWLDAEHRAFGGREIQSLLAYFHHCDIDCMFRPPTRERARLYRYLEDGATGLMIPHVSSAEDAEALANSVKFPPLGDRGLDAAGFDSDFLLHGGVDEYVESANRESFLVIQIETLQAVESVEEIASVPGIDGLFVGPGDLGLRIRRSNAPFSLDEAVQRVADAASRHGKAWGRPASSADQVAQLHGQGAQLIAYGGDFITLMRMLEKHAAELDVVYGESRGAAK